MGIKEIKTKFSYDDGNGKELDKRYATIKEIISLEKQIGKGINPTFGAKSPLTDAAENLTQGLKKVGTEVDRLKTKLEPVFQKPTISRYFENEEKAVRSATERIAGLVDNAKASINRPISIPQTGSAAPGSVNFNDTYKNAFTDIDRRIAQTSSSFQKLSQTKFEKGNFDIIGQQAFVAEKELNKVANQLRQIKREAADPANAKFGKYYVDGIRQAEAELSKYETKLRSLKRQQLSNPGGGGIPSGGGLGDIFGNNPLLAGITGGLVGAGAFGVISAAQNVISSLASKITDLSVKSIKVAGDFESTTNSLAIFAGGVGNARNELSALSKIALNTPGLTLESAETGFKRLRALNFETQVSLDLIRGLGIQRNLVGADAGAVDRVITNLTQLTSGAGTAADVRQTIGAIPSLRGVFKKAFGTADFGDINKIARENPDAFIKKFAAELQNAETAQIGLNVSIEKGSDAILAAGRNFGEPFLEPVTRDIQKLTQNLNENEERLKSWGATAADTYRGVSATATAIGGEGGIFSKITGAVSNLIPGNISTILGSALTTLQTIGERERTVALAKEQKTAPTVSFAQLDSSQIKIDPITNTITLLNKELDKTPQVNEKLKAEEAAKEAEKLRQVYGQLLQTTNQLRLGEIGQNLELNKAIAVRDANGDSLKAAKQIADLEAASIRQQIALREIFATEQTANLSSEDFNLGKGLIISNERSADVAKLENQLLVNQINLQTQINQEIEKGKDKVKEFGKTYKSVFDDLFAKQGANNPVFTVFNEGNKALEQLKLNLKNLPEEMQKTALAMQTKLNANALFSARLDNRLEAFNLRETAAAFRNTNKPKLKIEDTNKFFADFIEAGLKQIAAANGGSGRSFNISTTADGKGFLGFTQTEKNPFTRFNSNIYTDANGKQVTGGFSQSDSRADLLYEFDRLGSGGSIRRERTFADLTEREKQEFFDKTQKNSPLDQTLNERLQKQIQIINSGAFTQDQQDIAARKLLAVAQTTDPNSLSVENRNSIATAAERQADAVERREAEKLDLQKEQLKVNQLQAENTAKLLEIVQKGGLQKLEITLKEDGSVEALLPPSPTNQDTQNLYGDGINFEAGSGRR